VGLSLISIDKRIIVENKQGRGSFLSDYYFPIGNLQTDGNKVECKRAYFTSMSTSTKKNEEVILISTDTHHLPLKKIRSLILRINVEKYTNTHAKSSG